MTQKENQKNLIYVKKIIKDELLTLKNNHNKYKKLSKDKKINEFKSKIDKIVEEKIFNKLKKTNINILSEENKKSWDNFGKKKLTWIVDPLDGTVNYIRDTGKCGISIALFDGIKPIFGVIGVYPDMKVYFGGPNFRSKSIDGELKVSNISKIDKSILCYGFPARYVFNKKNFNKTYQDLKKFAKIRMIGAASISLLLVAMGKAEVYKESNIMIWDIAAGMAIIIGAGGSYKLSKGDHKLSFNLIAHNNKIKL